MATRFVVRLELTKSAKEKLDAVTETNGMTQLAVTSRLVEWFASQPDEIQAAVLGRYPKSMEVDVSRLILKRMSGDKVAVLPKD